MFKEKHSTCFWIYRRKASLDHLPMIMIVKVGTLARYIAIAAPERMEWVPMSSGPKPRISLPIALTMFLRAVLMVVYERWMIVGLFPCGLKRLTCEEGELSG